MKTKSPQSSLIQTLIGNRVSCGTQLARAHRDFLTLAASLLIMTGYPAFSQTIFFDNFTNYPVGSYPSSGGWQLLYDGAGSGDQEVVSAPQGSGRALQMIGSACWGAQSYHSVSLPQKFTYEAHIMISGNLSGGCDANVGFFGIFNPSAGEWGTAYGQITFQSDGKIHIDSGTWADTVLMPYSPNTWYDIACDYNLSSQVMGVRINGSGTLAQVSTSASGSPTGIYIQAGHAESPTLLIENVSVIEPNPVLTGHVLCTCDKSPIAGARVQIGNFLATSSSSGSYTISNVPPGTYSTTVSLDNYITTNVTITIPMNVSFVTNNFSLIPNGTMYWDTSVLDASPGSGGTGMWDNSTMNWWLGGTGDIAWCAGGYAEFAGLAGTVTLGANVSASDLIFDTDGYTITGNSTLTLGGTTPTVSVNVGSTIIGCIIAGTGGLTYSGSGTLNLSGDNTYSGGTTISSGTLQLSGAGTLGNTLGSLTVSDDGTLDLGGTSQIVGAVTISSGTIQNGNLTGLTYDGESGTVNANLSGSAMTKSGSDELTLTGANTFTGLVLINEGTLTLGTDEDTLTQGSITSSGVSIAEGSTFDVSAIDDYTFSPPLLSANGIGTGSAAAVIKGSVNLGSQSILLTFFPTSFNGDLLHPSLYISEGTLSLNGTTISVNNASGSSLGIGTYRLIQQASGSIISSGISLLLPIGGAGIADGDWASIQVSGGNVNLVVTAPPEPPVIQNVLRSGNNLTFSISSPNNEIIQVLGTPSLTLPPVPVGSLIPATPPATSITIQNVTPPMFYWLKVTPQ